MLVEVDKQQLCMNQLIAKKTDIAKVEGDVIVNDVKPDVLSIISTSGIVCVYKKEIMEGKIRIDGCINTYIMYLADDENGSIRSLNTLIDFTQIMDIDNCKTNMILDEMVTLKNIEAKIINGRKMNINAMIEITGNIYSNESIEVIDNINNVEEIQILNEKMTVNSLVGEGCNKVYAKDTISLNETDDLAEIMKVNFRIINKDSKTSYNKVVTKADAEVGIMYLTEDNRINIVSARIPVMGFVDIENISDDNQCDIKYKLKNIIIKPNSGDNSNSIYIEAEIEIVCFAYETKEIELIKDLYSINEDLSFKENKVTAMIGKEKYRQTCKIDEEISLPDIGNNKIYDVCVTPNILNNEMQSNQIIYEGNINVKFIYQGNSGMDIKEVSLPLNVAVQTNELYSNSNIETTLEINKENFITGESGKINANIELLFEVTISDYNKINIIEEIERDECRANDSYSMVIYFVKEGDTLWNIAKKFKTRIEDIVRVNNIEDENKIRIGQQLYIPKYVRRSVAV